MALPSCRDCRFFGRWSKECAAPPLVQKLNGRMPAVAMRDYDEYCGFDGRFWEARLGLVASVATWTAKKLGWLQ